MIHAISHDLFHQGEGQRHPAPMGPCPPVNCHGGCYGASALDGGRAKATKKCDVEAAWWKGGWDAPMMGEMLGNISCGEFLKLLLLLLLLLLLELEGQIKTLFDSISSPQFVSLSKPFRWLSILPCLKLDFCMPRKLMLTIFSRLNFTDFQPSLQHFVHPRKKHHQPVTICFR